MHTALTFKNIGFLLRVRMAFVIFTHPAVFNRVKAERDRVLIHMMGVLMIELSKIEDVPTRVRIALLMSGLHELITHAWALAPIVHYPNTVILYSAARGLREAHPRASMPNGESLYTFAGLEES